MVYTRRLKKDKQKWSRVNPGRRKGGRWSGTSPEIATNWRGTDGTRVPGWDTGAFIVCLPAYRIS
jgi:hypothetical protein